MPRVTVHIAGPTEGTPAQPQTMECDAQSVAEVLQQCDNDVGTPLVDGTSSSLAPGVAVFVDGRDARLEGEINSPLKDGDVIHIICTATDT